MDIKEIDKQYIYSEFKDEPIRGIKYVKDMTGTDLKTAKDFVLKVIACGENDDTKENLEKTNSQIKNKRLSANMDRILMKLLKISLVAAFFVCGYVGYFWIWGIPDLFGKTWGLIEFCMTGSVCFVFREYITCAKRRNDARYKRLRIMSLHLLIRIRVNHVLKYCGFFNFPTLS